MTLIRSVAAVATLAVSLFAQGANCGVRFLTSVAGGSGQSGIMFDVENPSTTPVSICGFDLNIDATTTPVNLEVWRVTSGGTMSGVESTPSAWTLVAIANGIPSLGVNTTGTNNVLTPFPAAFNIGVAPGQRLGIALAVANTTLQNYTLGTAATPVGALASTDGTLNAYVGYGKAFVTGVGPFGTSFGDATGGRIPNVRIGYTTPNLPPLWELNSPASALDVDGVTTISPYALSPGNRHQCVGSLSNANLASTNVGLGWDLAFGIAAPVPAGGGAVATPGGQLFNLDFADPTLGFLLGLTFAAPFVPGAIPFTAPAPLNLSIQMANIDPSNVDGVALSGPVRFEAFNPTSTVVLSGSLLSDDGSVAFTTGLPATSPTCLTPIPALPFFGVVHTQFWVAMNGRVCLGSGAAAGDFSPTVAEGLTQAPFLGFWTDLNPSGSVSASIVVDWSTAPVVTVTYNNVIYYGQTGLLSGSLSIDAATGAVTLSGMGGFPPSSSTTLDMFVGITRGSGIATDPGPITFAPGTTGTSAVATDMLYTFGRAGTLATGVSSIVFTPAPSGYAFTAF